MANRKKNKSGIGNLDPGSNPGLGPWIDAANTSHGGSFPGTNPGPGSLPPEFNSTAVDSLSNFIDDNNVNTSTAAFAELLKTLQGNGNRNDAIARLIEYISRAGQMTDETRTFFIQFLSQLALSDDQRQYDYKMLQESRLYNDPMNALARFMGSGISRDAAIELLKSGSGGSGGVGSVIGSGSGISVPAMNTTGAQDLQRTQVAIGGAVDILGALCNLLNTGMSFAQGVESVKQMRFANFMNQEQKSAYDNVNKVTQAIQQMQLNGIIEPADIDSWQNADDVYKWLLDHRDTNAVKPLVSSGAFQGVFGTTLGRDMFNRHWHQQRDSRDYGTQLNQLIRQNELVNDLKEQDLYQSYYHVTSALYDLLMKQPQLLEEWNNYFISGENLQQEQFETTIYEDEAHSASIHNRIQTKVYESRVNGGLSDDSGIEMLSFDEWYRLRQGYLKSLSMHDEGDVYWEKFFRSNYRTAAVLSFIKEHQVDIMQNLYGSTTGNPNPTLSTILNTIKTLVDAGAFDALDVVAKPITPSVIFNKKNE